MTITKYTGNSAVMEDNIESDDEHLDDKLLLRLRKEKRITIVCTVQLGQHLINLICDYSNYV